MTNEEVFQLAEAKRELIHNIRKGQMQFFWAHNNETRIREHNPNWQNRREDS